MLNSLSELIVTNPIWSGVIIYFLIGAIIAYVGMHLKEGTWSVQDTTDFIFTTWGWVFMLLGVAFEKLNDNVFVPIVAKLNESIKNTTKL